MRSSLKRHDYEEFLVNVYFSGLPSEHPDYLQCCITTAYLDVCRTLRGLGQLECKDELRAKAVDVLQQLLSALKGHRTVFRTQTEFDIWHKETCEQLIRTYEGHHTLYVGQAQKWTNMTFKYIFTMGEDRLPGFGQVYQFCHAPLDRVLIDQLAKKYGVARPKWAWTWSKLNDYINDFPAS